MHRPATGPRAAVRTHCPTRPGRREALRVHAHTKDSDPIAEARVERNGDFSVVPRHRKPHILEVRVEGGVQTVRIEIH